MANFNINDALQDPNLLETATFARALSKDERLSKLKLEERGDLIKHIKDLTISGFALALACVLIYICISVLYSPVASPDDKKWATSIITLAASGTIGFLTGKSTK